jgi:hypothetical protein
MIYRQQPIPLLAVKVQLIIITRPTHQDASALSSLTCRSGFRTNEVMRTYVLGHAVRSACVDIEEMGPALYENPLFQGRV